MDIQFEFLEDEKILVIKGPDNYEISPYNTESLKRSVDKLIELNCYKCLIDFRNKNLIFSTTGPFSRSKILKEYKASRRIKFAWLIDEITEDVKFYQTVLVNRGWQVHMFTDYDQAIAWLNS